MTYPEHEKLQKVVDKSQIIGEFLEYLSSQGVHLRQWMDWTEEVTCDGNLDFDCIAGRKLSIFNGNDKGECSVCKGSSILTKQHEGWMPYNKSIPTMLADFFEIDQNKIEEEKRAMLDKLRYS